MFISLTLLMEEIEFHFQVLALWAKSHGRHTCFSKMISLVLCKDEGAFCPSIQFTSINHASEPRMNGFSSSFYKLTIFYCVTVVIDFCYNTVLY